MSTTLRTVTCFLCFSILFVGLASAEFEEPPAAVEVTQETLFVEPVPNERLRQVRLRVMDGEGRLVCDELSNGELLAWSPPLEAPDGSYRYEVTVISHDPSFVSRGQKSDLGKTGRTQQRIRGGFEVLDRVLRVIDPVGRSRREPGSPEEKPRPNSLRASVDPSPKFDLVQTFTQDIGIADPTPAVLYDDTDLSAQTYEWSTEVTSTGVNMLPSYFAVNDEVNSRAILTLATSTDGDNSIVTDSSGDVTLADGDLFVDRSEGHVGINTTLPPDDLSILDIQPVVHLEDSDSNTNSSTGANFRGGIALHEDELWLFTREGVDGILYWPFVIQGVPFDYSLTIRSQNDDPMIEGEGYVGVGISDPQAKLHVFSWDGQAQVLVEETATPQAVRTQFQLKNNGAPRFALENTVSGIEWSFQQSGPGNFLISKEGSGGPEMQVFTTGRVRMGPGGRNNFDLSPGGNLTIAGSLTTNGSTFPDYVFEPDYPLMPLTDLGAFIEKERHLPNIPSAEVVQEQGSHNMTELQLKMLEKIEELTLYLLEKDRQMRHKDTQIERLEARLAAIETMLSDR